MQLLLIGILSICCAEQKESGHQLETDKVNSFLLQDGKLLCDWVEEIVKRDQHYRSLPGMNPTHIMELVVLDSLIMAAGLTNDEFYAMPLEEQNPIKEQAKSIASIYQLLPQNVQDSIDELQTAIDLDNTEQVLQKLYQIDYPKLNDFTCFEESLIVFVHTPDDAVLREKVKQALSSRKSFIDPSQYKHILWHLNGRRDQDW